MRKPLGFSLHPILPGKTRLVLCGRRPLLVSDQFQLRFALSSRPQTQVCAWAMLEVRLRFAGIEGAVSRVRDGGGSRSEPYGGVLKHTLRRADRCMIGSWLLRAFL